MCLEHDFSGFFINNLCINLDCISVRVLAFGIQLLDQHHLKDNVKHLINLARKLNITRQDKHQEDTRSQELKLYNSIDRDTKLILQ